LNLKLYFELRNLYKNILDQDMFLNSKRKQIKLYERKESMMRWRKKLALINTKMPTVGPKAQNIHHKMDHSQYFDDDALFLDLHTLFLQFHKQLNFQNKYLKKTLLSLLKLMYRSLMDENEGVFKI